MATNTLFFYCRVIVCMYGWLPRVCRTDKLHSYVSGITRTFSIYTRVWILVASVCSADKNEILYIYFIFFRLFVALFFFFVHSKYKYKINELFTRFTFSAWRFKSTTTAKTIKEKERERQTDRERVKEREREGEEIERKTYETKFRVPI